MIKREMVLLDGKKYRIDRWMTDWFKDNTDFGKRNVYLFKKDGTFYASLESDDVNQIINLKTRNVRLSNFPAIFKTWEKKILNVIDDYLEKFGKVIGDLFA